MIIFVIEQKLQAEKKNSRCNLKNKKAKEKLLFFLIKSLHMYSNYIHIYIYGLLTFELYIYGLIIIY